MEISFCCRWGPYHYNHRILWKFCLGPFIRIWRRTYWNFHGIWTVMLGLHVLMYLVRIHDNNIADDSHKISFRTQHFLTDFHSTWSYSSQHWLNSSARYKINAIFRIGGAQVLRLLQAWRPFGQRGVETQSGISFSNIICIKISAWINYDIH